MSLNFLRIHLWWLFTPFTLLFFFLIRRTKSMMDLPVRQKNFLTVLRSVTCSLVLLALLQPVLKYSFVKKVRPSLAVILDGSSSMEISDPLLGKTLEKETGSVAGRVLEQALGKNFDLKYFSYSEDLSPLRSPSDLTASGTASDLAAGLRSFFHNFSREDFRGVLLFSDGQIDDSVQLRTILDVLKKSSLPLFSVRLPATVPYPDLAVRFSELNADEFFTDRKETLFLDLLNSLSFTVTSEIRLYDNTTLISKRTVSLPPGESAYSLTYSPPDTGTRKLKIILSPADQELYKKNNEDYLFVKVHKGKFRVLLISGTVSWEFKFLKRTLEQDQSLNLDVFLKKDAESLLQVPLENVNKSDLVILADLSQKDLPPSFFPHLSSRIRSAGLSLYITGGENSILSEQISDPSFKALLPFTTDPRINTILSPGRISMTRAGNADPVTLLAENPGLNNEAWQDMPPLDLVNRISARKNSRILAVLKDNQNVPVMGSGQAGLGQIFYFAGSPTWKWGFLNLPLTGENRTYLTFYRQLIRELTSSHLERLNLYTDKFVYQPGETVSVYAVLFDQNFRPLQKKTVDVELLQEQEKLKDFQLQNNRIEERFFAELDPQAPGEYTVRMNLSGTRRETHFVVRKDARETFRVGLNPSQLEKISRISGGSVLSPDTLSDLKDRISTQGIRREFSMQRELLSSFPVIFLIILLLTVEWLYRKTRGLM